MHMLEKTTDGKWNEAASYQENILSVVGIPVQTAGSDIPAEMTLDISKSPIEFDTYAEEFIKNFYENKLNAPSSLGYFTPLVYEDSRLIYIVGCRKNQA